MIIRPYKTKKVIQGDDILDVLKGVKLSLKEKDVIVVTSKIVSICEGRTAPLDIHTKDELAIKDAEWYVPRPKRGVHKPLFTITRNTLLGVAGIDKSNGNGNYVLYPEDPMQSAEAICNWTKEYYGLSNIGVVISDSRSTPLRRGATGIAVGWAGIEPLKDYRGKKDLFERELTLEVSNIVDAIAAAAVLVMGEGDEQTPCAIVSDAPVYHTERSRPGEEEVFVSLDEDLFAMFFKDRPWQKGGK